MADLYALTEQDVRVLKGIVDQVRGGRYGRGSVVFPNRRIHTSEVHIARTPEGGIPALSGTTPGSAECNIYFIDEGDLVEAGLDQTVYNLSGDDVAGDIYIQVVREKWGNWLAANPGAGSAPPSVHQPRGIRWKRVSSLTVNNNSETVVPWDTPTLDVFNNHDPVSPERFIPTLDGWYLIVFKARFATLSTAGSREVIIKQAGGNPVHIACVDVRAPDFGNHMLTTSALVSLLVGSGAYITCHVYQNSGVNMTLNSVTNDNAADISVVYLGTD